VVRDYRELTIDPVSAGSRCRSANAHNPMVDATRFRRHGAQRRTCVSCWRAARLDSMVACVLRRNGQEHCACAPAGNGQAPRWPTYAVGDLHDRHAEAMNLAWALGMEPEVLCRYHQILQGRCAGARILITLPRGDDCKNVRAGGGYSGGFGTTCIVKDFFGTVATESGRDGQQPVDLGKQWHSSYFTNPSSKPGPWRPGTFPRSSKLYRSSGWTDVHPPYAEVRKFRIGHLDAEPHPTGSNALTWRGGPDVQGASGYMAADSED